MSENSDKWTVLPFEENETRNRLSMQRGARHHIDNKGSGSSRAAEFHRAEDCECQPIEEELFFPLLICEEYDALFPDTGNSPTISLESKKGCGVLPSFFWDLDYTGEDESQEFSSSSQAQSSSSKQTSSSSSSSSQSSSSSEWNPFGSSSSSSSSSRGNRFVYDHKYNQNVIKVVKGNYIYVYDANGKEIDIVPINR